MKQKRERAGGMTVFISIFFLFMSLERDTASIAFLLFFVFEAYTVERIAYCEVCQESPPLSHVSLLG
jgi:hypothetical protein